MVVAESQHPLERIVEVGIPQSGRIARENAIQVLEDNAVVPRIRQISWHCLEEAACRHEVTEDKQGEQRDRCHAAGLFLPFGLYIHDSVLCGAWATKASGGVHTVNGARQTLT